MPPRGIGCASTRKEVDQRVSPTGASQSPHPPSQTRCGRSAPSRARETRKRGGPAPLKPKTRRLRRASAVRPPATRPPRPRAAAALRGPPARTHTKSREARRGDGPRRKRKPAHSKFAHAQVDAMKPLQRAPAPRGGRRLRRPGPGPEGQRARAPSSSGPPPRRRPCLGSTSTATPSS